MKIVFFGTPDYVLPILNALHRRLSSGPGKSSIVAVVTQKPKPTGRKRILTYSPVDKWAYRHKIPVFYSSQDLLKEGIKADLGILESYGEILSKEVIHMFPHGILNAHPSLLPRWRGASPVQAAIVAGDKETGVTIIKLDEQVDHGPIISRFREDISDADTTEGLRKRLFERSCDVLVALIKPYLEGKIKPQKQNDKEATFTTRITKEHAFVPPEYLEAALQGILSEKKWETPFIKDYSLVPDALSLERFVRAMDPWPGAWSTVKISDKKLRIKLLETHLEGERLVLDLVQLEGKNPVSYDEFKRGYPKAALE